MSGPLLGYAFPTGLSTAWDGTTEDESEALLILHTRRSLVPAVIARARDEHPYDVPQVVVLAVTDANPDYVDWLLAATGRTGATDR